MVLGLPSVCLAAVLVVGILAPLSCLALPAFVAVPETIEDDEAPVLDRVERSAGSGGGAVQGSSWQSTSSGEGDYTRVDDEDYNTTPVRRPETRQFHVETSITARYASTLVAALLLNPVEYPQEATFSVVIPEDAFISNFLMVVEGVVYEAEVKEKEKAQREYNAAKERGQTAGQVKQHATRPNTFGVSVNVAAYSNVLFNLTYQELLHRRHGQIEYRLNLNPGQLVKSLKVDVRITEPQSLQELAAVWEPSQAAVGPTANDVARPLQEQVRAERLSQYRAHVKLHPSKDQQKTERSAGVAGDLVVRYDVLHDLSAGNLQVMNGYFVHYFSPEGLPPARKNVVFVIDVSGSMYGLKMEQTKEAMRTILADIREGDRLNIVTFTDSISIWREGQMVDRTEDNIASALAFVDELQALYGTNLHGGVMTGVELLKTETLVSLQDRREAYSMIIMLTDGLPSSGVTNHYQIRDDFGEAIDGKMSLFCLGFGDDLDHDFLESLASENQGVARKIYTDSDAALQLRGFYDEVATPLLFNIQIQYNHLEPAATTGTDFLCYFEGTEIVVAGRLPDRLTLAQADGGDELVATVSANAMDAFIELETSVPIQTPSSMMLSRHVVDDFCQRLWAYMTIKSLLKSAKISRSREERDELKARAMELSMKYHFVTPLTSLLVIRPEDRQPESNSTGSLLGAETGDQAEDGDQALEDDLSQPSSAVQSSVVRGSVGQSRGSTGNSRSRTTGAQSASRVRGGGGGGGGGGFADSDPHFVVHVPASDISVCFDILGEAGQVFRLLTDEKSGLEVLGFIVAAPKPVEETGRFRTYFGRIGVRLPGGYTVKLDTGAVTIDDQLVLDWKKSVTVYKGNWSIALRKKEVVISSLEGAVGLAFVLHRMNPNNIFKVDHLGFYIINHEGLTDGVHGLIGQFQRRTVEVDAAGRSEPAVGAKAELLVAGRRVPAVRKARLNSMTGRKQPCWFAADNARGLLDGKHTDYLAPLRSMP